MNEKQEKNKQTDVRDDGLNWLLTLIFMRAMPVWHRYKGAVPPEALYQLEVEGDWPLGIAAATMQRLSRDPELRRWLAALKWRIEYE